MPTIGAFSTQASGFLNSRITSDSTAGNSLAPEQQAELTHRMFNTNYQESRGSTTYGRIAGYATGAIADFADTAASSVIPGVDRGDVWNFIGDHGGSLGRELENFHANNTAGIEALSGIGGAIGIGYLGGSVLLPRISSALASSSFINGSRLWQMGAAANAAVRSRVEASQLAAAMQGEAFSAWAGGKSYLAMRAGQYAGVAAFEEAMIASTMHTNNMIWTDDMSENLFYAGIGVGIGAGLGSMAARYEMRRMVNSPEMIKARIDAIDPQGFTGLREHQPDANWLRAQKDAKVKDSAILTSLMLDARQETPKGAVPEMASRFDTLRTQGEEQAAHVLQRIGSKGVKGVDQTQFRVEGSVGKHLTETLHEDPTAAFGLDSLGSLSNVKGRNVQPAAVSHAPSVDPIIQQARADHTAFGSDPKKISAQKAAIFNTGGVGDSLRYQAEIDRLAKVAKNHAAAVKKAQQMESPLGALLGLREAYTDALGATRVTKNIREANRLKEQQPLVLVNKSWMPAETPEAMALSVYKPGDVKFKQTASTASEFTFATESGKKIRVNESFEPKIGNGNTVKFHHLPMNDQMQVLEGMNQVFGNMRRNGMVYVAPQNPSWFQLDSAIEYANRGGKVDWVKAGVNSVEEAQLASLKLKAKELLGNNQLGSYWTRLTYNLPLPSSTERIYDAAGDTMRAVLEAADKGAGLPHISQLWEKLRAANGFELRHGPEALDGNLFRFNRDAENKWRDMAVGFFDNEKQMKPMNLHGIAEQVAEAKAARYHILTNQPSNPNKRGVLVSDLTQRLHATPEYQASSQLRHLADDMVTGLGSWGKQLAGEVVTREFRYRDNPVMQALLKVRELVNRMTDERLSALLKHGFGDVQARLNAAPAAPSKALVNQFFSNSSGWDLKHAPVDLGNGKWAFELEESDKNAARLGRKVVKGETLVNPRTGAQVVLDDLGLEFAERFNNISNRILRDKNRLRSAMGLSELNERAWYTPPPNTKGMHIGFTFDANNNPVPGGAIRAKNREDFERLRAAKLKKNPQGHTFRTREQIEETADLWDRAAMDWIDPGVGPAPARGQTGTLASDLVNPEAVGDTLQWIKNQMESIGTNTMRTLYDSQLGIARARGATERAVRGFKKDSPLRTIWDEYEATVLGKNLGEMQRSISGQVAAPLEKFINGGLETVWPAMAWMAPSQMAHWLGDVMQKMGVKAPKSARTFEQLANQLGPYTPYKNAVDYAEQTLKINRPPEIKDIADGLNRLSAALLLRQFELPQAAMNLIGIMTTMPSILRSGRAPVTSFFDTPTGRVGSLDTMKVLTGGIKDMLNPAKHADFDFMVKNGDTTQQVAEFNKQFGMVKDRSTFGRVFLGDAFADPSKAKGALGKTKAYAQQKGIDGLISIATDVTENWSRTYSHFVGLRLADMQGIVGKEARHSFAREIANAAIANYNPMNKPELYHSAFGSMFGLFMSWMQSYNQRMFRWMEQGDYAAVGRQLGMQSAQFGVGSLPGYAMVERFLLSSGMTHDSEGNEATLTDHIYAKFGPKVGSILNHGGINELGLVFYTRGDMNYRSVTLDPSQLMAGVSNVKAAYDAVGEAAQSLFSSASVSDNGRLSEIVARYMPNRAMKGALAMMLNDGKDIDSHGQIVSESRSFFESAVRMAGLRTSRQAAEVEAFYANKQMQQREAARMDVLRQETRSLLRTEGWEGRIQEVFDKYLQLGGRPDGFRTWIKDQVRSAQSTRGMNELVKAMQNPKTQQEVWRYNAYGGGM